jgi:hypothetical protein
MVQQQLCDSNLAVAEVKFDSIGSPGREILFLGPDRAVEQKLLVSSGTNRSYQALTTSLQFFCSEECKRAVDEHFECTGRSSDSLVR